MHKSGITYNPEGLRFEFRQSIQRQKVSLCSTYPVCLSFCPRQAGKAGYRLDMNRSPVIVTPTHLKVHSLLDNIPLPPHLLQYRCQLSALVL